MLIFIYYFIISLSLPINFKHVKESEAIWSIKQIKKVNVKTLISQDSIDIPTTFYQFSNLDNNLKKNITFLFLHGTDSSCLEWRFIMKKMSNNNINCVALDWWTGGWTERKHINDYLMVKGYNNSYSIIKNHIYSFCNQYLNNSKIILVGASLGGAIAIDFAYNFPELIYELILIDSGGISYKSPPPIIVSKLAHIVVAVKQIYQVLNNFLGDNKSKILGLHRNEPYYYQASLLYFLSGGIENQVNIKLIEKVKIKTSIIWGTNDYILPLKNAYEFEKKLDNCYLVSEIPNCGHCPHLEKPEYVFNILKQVWDNN